MCIRDRVYSRDEYFKDDSVAPKRVIELYRYEDRATLDVTIEFEDGAETKLRTTPEHPFAVKVSSDAYEKELEAGRVLNADTISISKTFAWKSAGDLNIGDKTVDMTGRIGLVTAKEPVGTLSTVHNFAVEDFHTYYVGDGPSVWVHNQYQDAIEEHAESPVQENNDILDDLFVDESGNLHLFIPGVTDENGNIIVEPSLLALGGDTATSGQKDFFGTLIGGLYNFVRDVGESYAAYDLNDSESRLKALGFRDGPVDSVATNLAIFQADNIDYTIFSGREHGAALYNGLIGAPLEGLLHLASYQAAFETFHDLGETATFAEVSALQKSAASQINGSITFSVDSDLQNAANFAALGIDGVFLFKSLPSLGARSVSNLGDVGDYAGRFGDLRSAVAHLRDSGYTRLDSCLLYTSPSPRD